ncbi:unnamed protein product [Timema podura]|uniref:Fibronectin type-III domain-containing protein n=1 Tax=Timema podura TaxID=61482 RepID=A0ABN7NDF7_TIMPD|nr:unnamed protein product [Timema podura]
MELLELPGLSPRFNLSVPRGPPVFDVYGMEPGASYRVHLYATNAKGRSEPFVIEPITFKGVAKFTGPSTPLPMNPVLTGLIATATGLLIVVCAVVVALYRRHRRRRCPRASKLNQLDGNDDSAVVDSGCQGVGHTTPLNPTCASAGVIVVGDHRGVEETDPDIIPSKYERRPLKGFMKMYKTPPQRRRKKTVGGSEDEDEATPQREQLNHRHIAKEIHNEVNNVCSMRAHKGVTASSPIRALPADLTPSGSLHSKLGPEVYYDFAMPSAVSCELSVITKEAMGLLIIIITDDRQPMTNFIYHPPFIILIATWIKVVLTRPDIIRVKWRTEGGFKGLAHDMAN